MSYNVSLRTKNIAGEINIFDSSQVRWVRGGITLDVSQVREIESKKRLEVGEFLAKLTSGKYAPVKRSATTGTASSAQAVITLDGDVLGGAARFQVGDTVVIAPGEADEETHDIESIDYDTGAVTLDDNLANEHDAGTVVQVADAAEAVLMLGETVDFALDGGSAGSYGDQAATAFDWARVIDARLPRQADATIKSELKNITFA